MKQMEFTVDSASILAEVARHFSGGADSDAPGIVMGCNEIRRGLVRISQRAIVIGDEELLRELVRLGCLRATESSQDKSSR